MKLDSSYFRGMALLEELVLLLDQPSPRDGFVEFPGQLGVNIIVGWDISDALKAKHIPLEALNGVEYDYNTLLIHIKRNDAIRDIFVDFAS
ncbi:hypothetical protein C5167_031175 [Papaver somniferum]|nr:hypothetical protein C5167_031175 [Papaver somniferum]